MVGVPWLALHSAECVQTWCQWGSGAPGARWGGTAGAFTLEATPTWGVGSSPACVNCQPHRRSPPNPNLTHIPGSFPDSPAPDPPAWPYTWCFWSPRCHGPFLQADFLVYIPSPSLCPWPHAPRGCTASGSPLCFGETALSPGSETWAALGFDLSHCHWHPVGHFLSGIWWPGCRYCPVTPWRPHYPRPWAAAQPSAGSSSWRHLACGAGGGPSGLPSCRSAAARVGLSLGPVQSGFYNFVFQSSQMRILYFY